MNDINLSHAFGMCEMESSAKRIIERTHDLGMKDVSMCANMFYDEHLMTGFLHLIYGGFMDPGKYNGEFVPNEEFWERIPKEYHP